MILKRTISKEEVKEMPKAAFPGRIHVIQTESEAQKAVAYLQSQAILGIDSETRPSFTKGHSHKVALLQISSDECCFLFRLNMTGLTQPIIELLEDPKVIKVGLSLKDDFMMLHKRAPFNQQACIELQEYVRPFGIQDKSLQKIYGILFSEKISKSQRLSNWEADVLTDAQKQYAATDAWACLNIYHLLEELKRTGNYELAPEEEATPQKKNLLPKGISRSEVLLYVYFRSNKKRLTTISGNTNWKWPTTCDAVLASLPIRLTIPIAWYMEKAIICPDSLSMFMPGLL